MYEFAPNGGYGGPATPINPAFSVTPFITEQGFLDGTDLVVYLPSSIYPRSLVGINYVGPSNATEFEVALGSPTNKVDSSNIVANNTLKYDNPKFVPPGTQVFCRWRNASVVIPVAATIAEVVYNMSQTNTQVVVTSSGTQPGERLYAFHYDAFMNTNGEPVNMNPPSGTIPSAAWTALASTANGAGACGMRLWRAITTALGAHIVESNQTDGSSSNGLIVVRAQNVFFDVANAAGLVSPTSAGPDLIAPDIGGGVQQAEQDWVFRGYCLNNGQELPVPDFPVIPAPYTELADQHRAFNDEQMLMSALMTTGASSIGQQIATNDQPQIDAWGAISLIIRGISAGTSQAGSVTFQLAPA